MLKCTVHDIQVSVYSCLHISDLIIYHSLNVDIAWNGTKLTVRKLKNKYKKCNKIQRVLYSVNELKAISRTGCI